MQDTQPTFLPRHSGRAAFSRREAARPETGNSHFLSCLLFLEVCLLCAVAGILASRFPAPGALLFLGLWLLDSPRAGAPAFSRSAALRPLLCHGLLLLLCFLLAFAYAAWRSPEPPPVPEWLAKASFPQENVTGEQLPPQALRVRAEIAGVTPLPGGRVRVLLRAAAPVPAEALRQGAPSHIEALPTEEYPGPDTGTPSYQGLIVWTWYTPDRILLPGQKIEASMRLAPVRGFANPGVWDAGQYWADRKVWFRAWSGKSARLEITESVPGVSARLRQWLRNRFQSALPGRSGVVAWKGAGGAAHEEKITVPAGDNVLLPGAALLPALVFGDRSLLTPETQDRFARSTLAHSLALSGLHLSFAVLAGFALVYCIGRFFPGLWLRCGRPKAALLTALPLAMAYLWLGQYPVSLLRAFCMLCFWTLLLFLKRPRVMLDGLLAALFCILLADPAALFDVSLQLSALSVACLALTLPRLQAGLRHLVPERRFSEKNGRRLRAALLLLGSSLCIQLALLPLTVRIFGVAGILFPLNLLWLPVLGVLVMPPAFLGLLAAGFALEPAAQALLLAASLPCEALLRLLETLDNAGMLAAPLLPRPHWLSCAGYWLLLPALSRLFFPNHASPFFLRDSALLQKSSYTPGHGKGGFTWGTVRATAQETSRRHAFLRSSRPSLLPAVAGCIFLLGPPAVSWLENYRETVELRLIDVGQGQAVLVEWSGMAGPVPGGRALVDGGGFSSTGGFDPGKAVLAPLLTDNALPRVTMVINSHPDTDHLAGLLYVLERFRVEKYYTNGTPAVAALEQRQQSVLQQRGMKAEPLVRGSVLELAPGLRLEVLSPSAAFRDRVLARPPGAESGNNASIILRLVWKDRALALMCGDAEIPALQELMLDSPFSLQAQVLVLPHHGSASSHNPRFYDLVQPELALASCAFANRWGFPAKKVRDSLAAAGIPLATTAEAGQVRLRWQDPARKPEMECARAENCFERLP